MNAICLIFIMVSIVLTPSEGQYGPLRKPKKHHTTTPFPEDSPGFVPESNAISENQPQQIEQQSQSYWWQNSNNPFSGPNPNVQPPQQVIVEEKPFIGGVQPEVERIACNNPGYVCVLKHHCQNGVVVSGGQGIFQVRSGTQYCNAASQVCCQLPAQSQTPQLVHGSTSQQPSQPTLIHGTSQPTLIHGTSQSTLIHGVVPSRPVNSYGSTAVGSNLIGPTPGQPDHQTSGSFAASQYYKPVPGTNGIPIGGSIYDHSVVTKSPDVRPYTGPLNTTPHPGCAAALKCVQEVYCTVDGVMSDTPVTLTREQYENKVPLSDCADPDTGIIGKCCRDPNYKDPWPGGMMMPKPGDQVQIHSQTQIHTHTQPDECGPVATCVHGYQCSNQNKVQPIKNCRVPLDGASGMCCRPDQPVIPSASNIPPISVSTVPPSQNSVQTYFSTYQSSTGNPFFPPSIKPQPVPQPPKPPTYPQPPSVQPFPQQPPPAQPFPQQPPPAQPFPQQPPPSQPFPQQPPPVQPFPQQPPTAQPFPQKPPPQPFPVNPPSPQIPQQPYQPPTFPEKQPTPQVPQQPLNPPTYPQKPPTTLPFPERPPSPQVPQQTLSPPTFPQKPATSQPFPSQIPPHSKPPLQQSPKPQLSYPAPPLQTPPPFNLVPGEKCGLRRQVPRNGLSDFDAAFSEFPWQALVINAQNESALCSAAIISKNAVVTAAHCVQRLESRDLLVKAGVWKIRSSSQPKPVQVSSVAAIARHPNFDSGSLFNDLAVLFLSQDLSMDEHVDTICLPPRKQSYPQNTCVATGWGKAALQGGDYDDILHQIPVQLVPSTQCQDTLRATYLGRYFILNESFKCAAPLVRDTDLCKVGLGGPLACEPGDGRYVLSGVYSWDVGCGPSTNPSVFSEIDVDWINGLLKKPVTQLAQDELNEILRQQNEDQQALQGVDTELKPGFQQGYGKK